MNDLESLVTRIQHLTNSIIGAANAHRYQEAGAICDFIAQEVRVLQATLAILENQEKQNANNPRSD